MRPNWRRAKTARRLAAPDGAAPAVLPRLSSSACADMWIAEAIEAILDMSCVVAHKAGIGAGSDHYVIPAEAGDELNRDAHPATWCQGKMLTDIVVLIGEGHRGRGGGVVLDEQRNHLACNF